MKQKRHTTDQIIPKLRRADVDLGKGMKVPEVCKLLEITEQTYLSDIFQMDSDSTLVNAIDAQSTPIGSVNQRTSHSRRLSVPSKVDFMRRISARFVRGLSASFGNPQDTFFGTCWSVPRKGWFDPGCGKFQCL